MEEPIDFAFCITEAVPRGKSPRGSAVGRARRKNIRGYVRRGCGRGVMSGECLFYGRLCCQFNGCTPFLHIQRRFSASTPRGKSSPTMWSIWISSSSHREIPSPYFSQTSTFMERTLGSDPRSLPALNPGTLTDRLRRPRGAPLHPTAIPPQASLGQPRCDVCRYCHTVADVPSDRGKFAGRWALVLHRGRGLVILLQGEAMDARGGGEGGEARSNRRYGPPSRGTCALCWEGRQIIRSSATMLREASVC